jgi:hypothetical protein
MFARKLGRIAGFVLVLSVVFGGAGAAHADASDARRASAQTTASLGTDWD